jgi:hypothetical protein
MNESLSKVLHEQTLSRLIDRLALQEVHGIDGGAYLPLVSKVPMVSGSLGQVQVFRGGPIAQLVTTSIVVPPIGLDSHMLFAFADTESTIPHFTLDSVRNGADYAFHLDLIPRVDLAVDLAYMDEVYTPLTATFKKQRELPGLKPAQLDPRQYAVMSPWMLVNRADESAFRASFDAVNAYLDHWFLLVEGAIGKSRGSGYSAAALASRDEAHRSVLFNPEVDKVWNQITPLIGAEAVARIIALLRNTRAVVV